MAFRNYFQRVRGSQKRNPFWRRPLRPRQLNLEYLEDRTLLAIPPHRHIIGPSLIFDGSSQGITNERPIGDNPVIGAIQVIAPHPTNPNVVFVGSVNGGIYKADDVTGDHGGFFINATPGYPSLSIGDIAYSPVNTNVVYAGIGNFSSANRPGGPLNGLLRSTDADGASPPTWTVLGQSTFQGQEIVRVVPTRVNNGNVVLVGTRTTQPAGNGGFFRSTDAGVTWTQIPPTPCPAPGGGPCGLPAGDASDLVRDPTNDNRFYAAIPSAPRSVYRSDDGGISWDQVNIALPAGGPRIRLAVGAQGVIYAATMGPPPCTISQSNCQLTNVYRSASQGAAWATMGVPSPTIHPGGQAGVHFSMVADPDSQNVVFVGGDAQSNSPGCTGFTGIHFRGVFGGSPTWSSIDCNGASGGGAPTSPHPDSRAMAFSAPLDAAGNRFLFEADDGGLYKLLSPNAAADVRRWVSAAVGWAPAASFFSGIPTEFFSIAYDSVNHTYFGGAQDLGAIDQLPPIPIFMVPSSNWRVVDQGDGEVAAADNTSQPGRSTHYTSVQNLGSFRRRTFDNMGHLVDGGDHLITLNVANTNPTRNLFQVESNVPAHTCAPGETPPPGQGQCTSTVLFWQPYVLNQVDPRRMIIGTSFLYESTDQGDTLTSLGGVQEVPPGSGNWQPIMPVGQVQAIGYGGRRGGVDNPDVLWVGTQVPRACGTPPCFTPQLRLRTNAVGLPAVLPAYTAAGGSLVRAIQMDPADWQTAYVLDAASRVWRTTDSGNTFVELTGNLCNLATDLNPPNQGMDLRTIEVVRSGADVAVLVGGLGGVYKAINPGPAAPCTAASQNPRTWTHLGLDGPTSNVWELHYNAADDKIFAGGLGTAMVGLFGASSLFFDSIVTIGGNSVTRLNRDPNTRLLNIWQDGIRQVEGYPSSIQQIVINDTGEVDIDDSFLGVPVTINNRTVGTTVINISQTARNLNTIQGAITINGGPGTTLLNVFDQAGTSNSGFLRYTMTETSLTRQSSALINYSSVSAITINGSSNNSNTFAIQGLAANTPTTFNLTGVNTVFIGAQNLDRVRSNLTLNGMIRTLDIDDRDNPAGRSFTILADRVSYDIAGFGTINVSYDFRNVASLTIHVGAGVNTITVVSTSPFTTTTLDPGNGRNTVDVQSGILNGIGGGASPGSGFGRYTIEAGATLNFVSGTFTLGTDSSITGAGTVTFSGSTNFTLAGAYSITGLTQINSPSTVIFNGAASTAQLVLAAGTLGGAGDLIITDLMSWTGGAMSGTGRTLINTRLEISGSNPKGLDARRLENAGQAVWTGAGDILVSNGGIFTNQPVAVFDIQSDVRIRQGSGVRGQFNNAGSLRKSAGTQTTAVEVNLDNTGTVDVQTGTLGLLADGTDSGAFSVAAGATLGFDGGAPTLTVGSMITASGTLHFGASTTTIGATIGLAAGSNLVFEAGTHALTADSSVTGTSTVRFASPANVSFGGAYNITGLTRSSGGQANFNSDASTTQLALEGGFIGGSAGLIVSDATTWTAGGYNGAGHLRANGGIAISGPAPKQLANGTLDNAGLAAWIDAGPLQIFQGGTWNNLPASTLEARNDAVMQGVTGPLGNFVNAGLFRKTQSSGTTSLSVVVTNSGTMQVQTGTVLLDGPFTNLNGTTLAGGTFQVQTTLQIPSADIRTNGATLILDGVSSIISRDNQRTDALANLAINTSDGSVTIRNGRALTTAGSFTNAGLFAMEDTGSLTLQGNWSNSGRFQWNGSGEVLSFGTTRFDNLAGATFDIRGNARFRNNSNFINAGDVRKSAGAGTSNFENTGFNNNGTVEAMSGNLKFNNGGASTGSFSVSAGATLTFGSSTHLFSPASSISGPGRVTFGGGSFFTYDGTAIIQGTYAVTGSTLVNGEYTYFASSNPVVTGDLTIGGGGTAYFAVDATATTLTMNEGGLTTPSVALTGPATVTVSGLTTWTGAAMTGTGRTIAQGGLVLSGPDQKVLDTRTLVNAGTGIWMAGDWTFSHGAVLNNPAGSVFDIQSDGSTGFTGAPGRIDNAGILRKSARTGTTAIDGAFLNNSGTVDIASGTLHLGFSGSSTSGSFTVQAGATLDFFFGTHRLGDTSAILGAGIVRFSGAAVTLTGAYNLTGDTVISAGTAQFDADASTGTLALSGVGVLTGAGTVTVTGQTTWTGGTMSGTGRTIALGGLQLGGDSKSLQNRSFDNAGPAVWTGGDIFSSAATFSNLAGADFDIRGDVRFLNSFDAVFNNAGTLDKSAGTGVSEISSVLNNSGAVEVQAGTLRLSGGGDSTGNFTIDANTTLDFAGGDHLLEDSAGLTDNGRLTVTLGTVYYAGDVTLTNGAVLLVDRLGTLTIAGGFTQSGGSTILTGGTLAVGSGIFLQGGTLSGAGQIIGDVFNAASIMVGDATTAGTLNITGNYTQTADGLLRLKLGGTAAGRFDQLVVSGSAALAGTLRITLFAGYVPASGDSLRVLTAGTRTGTFDTLDGDGPLFNPLYDATGLTLRRP